MQIGLVSQNELFTVHKSAFPMMVTMGHNANQTSGILRRNRADGNHRRKRGFYARFVENRACTTGSRSGAVKQVSEMG
jgi:hypothetical protein